MADGTPKVGYRRPPTATQFKPGQSGNPRGRSRGSRNFRTALTQELDARIDVTESGQRKKISKRRALAKQLVNKSASGDARSIALLLPEIRKAEEGTGPGPAPEPVLGPVDQVVTQSIIARMRRVLMAELSLRTSDAPWDGKERRRTGEGA